MNEKLNENFICSHCQREVINNNNIGTKNRNHCPFCLWSKHVDEEIPGDRRSTCLGNMKPEALTFKKERADRWGRKKQGEIMLVHVCERCNKINFNRIAADDDATEILSVLKNSFSINETLKEKFKSLGLDIISEKMLDDVKEQLYGKDNSR